jgi:hypothetical protein
LDQLRSFGVLQPFLEKNFNPIWYNEGEGKNGSFFFILSGETINHYIFFSLLVNDLIIIAKYLGHPFLFLVG